jgi:hypothetical protein
MAISSADEAVRQPLKCSKRKAKTSAHKVEGHMAEFRFARAPEKSSIRVIREKVREIMTN